MHSITKNLLSISIYATWLIVTVVLISLSGGDASALAAGTQAALVQDDLQAAAVAPATESVAEGSAASLFTANCAGCHAGGGNVIRRGKTLKLKKLARYGYDDAESISQIVANGRGIMPAFAERLDAEEIGAIAQYVLAQAEAGW